MLILSSSFIQGDINHPKYNLTESFNRYKASKMGLILPIKGPHAQKHDKRTLPFIQIGELKAFPRKAN